MKLRDLLNTLSEFQYLVLKTLGTTVYYAGNAHDVPSEYRGSEVREISASVRPGVPEYCDGWERVRLTIWIDPIEERT